jgi:hypothetical protein
MLGLFLTAITVAGCSSSGTKTAASSAGPGTAAGTGTAAAGPATSAQTVLHSFDAPSGTTYLASASGPQSLQQLVKGDQDAAKEIALLKQAGFRDAYLSIFTGLQLPASVTHGHFVESFAVVFGSPSSAVSGLDVLTRTALTSGQRNGTAPTTGLGPHARGIRYAITTFPGDSYLLAWAQGNTVRLLIDGGGTGVVTAAAALQLAQRVYAAPIAGATGTALAARAVLPPGDAPAGTGLTAARSGARTLAQFAPAKADAATLRRLGFVVGYTRQYLSPGLANPSSAPPADARQSNYIASQAQHYDGPADAQRAYVLFRARELKLLGSQAVRLATPALGPNATGLRYVDHRTTGDLIGYAYFWRHGPFMLSLFDVGTSGFASTSTALGLAHTMAAHAGG